ncbi:hypothetical protein J2046_004311 [Rhizobium petrolearium]|uniref:Uncharacterized protein n=1 Tax=Neorhizobium petrolearium TaxID=515361 RepID=A0ABY8M6M7_9HYPH|nr:hypothetical protein [Neorhizobium petrolearium]MBP1846037.1 hypothetical protein [Neorhizobium petrolearium]WGI70183.1 hypothetical protein QEO92_09130 [Neorhizobium petrolearium]
MMILSVGSADGMVHLVLPSGAGRFAPSGFYRYRLGRNCNGILRARSLAAET